MAVKDFDAQYGGYGIPSNPTQDSGVVAVSTTPKTITLTVPQINSVNVGCMRGQVYISCNTMNGAAVLGQIDISSSDGTHTVCLDSIPAAVAATAGRGGCFNRSVFIDRIDTTTISTIVVVIATSANNNYSAQVRFLSEHD